MLIKHQALALAAAALLAGCGGGDSTETPQVAAASALRMRALSTQQATTNAVAPEVAAEQLMNYGEGALPQYFPEHATTQTFGPFRYRAYSNGILLGVVVQADATYTLNHVYVMGGAFGNSPLDVGPLTNYITPTDPNTNPTGANNGCADLSKADTQGTHVVEVFDYSGPVSGTQTVDTLVGGTVAFEGQQATETSIKTTGTNMIAGISTAIDTQGKAYAKRTGDAELTHYGLTLGSSTSIAGVTSTTETKSVFSPPWVDKIYALAIGESLTVSYNVTTTGSTTMTSPIPGFPPVVTPLPSTSSVTNQTIKYVGRETVTVPAGTYNTCRFDYTTTDGTSSQWIIVGNGLMAKSTATVQGKTQLIQATSITLNGQKI